MTEVLCSDPQEGRLVYYFILKNTAAYVINENERQKVRSNYYRKGVQQPLTEEKSVQPIYTDLFCFYISLRSRMNKEQAHLYSAPGSYHLVGSIYQPIIIR